MKKIIFLILMFAYQIVYADNDVVSLVPEAIPESALINHDSLYWEKDGVEYNSIQLVFSKARFPGYDTATRVLSFDFNMSYDLAYSNHFAVMVATDLENHEGKKIMRGIIFGNVSEKVNGDGCVNYPSVQFETFNIALLHHDENKCAQLESDVWYKLDLYISKHWIAFYLHDEFGNLIESDGINASEEWFENEYSAEYFYDYGVSQAFLGFPSRGLDDEYVEVRNIHFGYFLNDQN